MLASSSSSTTSETPSSSKSMPGPPRLAASPADLEEGLHQLPEERVRPHVGREVVGGPAPRVRDAGRQQPVGDGLRIHVGKAVCIKVADEHRLERLHELGQRAALALDGERRLDAVSDRPRELRKADRELARSPDDLAIAEREGRPPALPPGRLVLRVLGPSEIPGQLLGHVV
jgi:hypothetical protein